MSPDEPATGPDPTATGPDPTATGPDPTATGDNPSATGPKPSATGPKPAATGDNRSAGQNLGTSGHTHRTLTAEEAAEMEEKIRKIEIAISLVLRVGVTLSVAILAVGLGLMFAHHSGYTSFTGHFSYHSLTSRKTAFPHSFGGLVTSLEAGQGRGVVVVGILVLILTPILRVAVGVISFMYEKDPPMTIVTLYVLAVLIASFFLGGA